MDNLKECILEIINNIKDENIMDFIEEMKLQNGIILNIFIKHYYKRYAR